MRFIAAFLLVIALTAGAVPIIELKIKESAGVARSGEDVTMGVPLPEAAAFTDASKFTLRDKAGTIIPCQITATCQWFKNPSSIRWLQLNFPYSIAAKDSGVVVLHSESTPYVLPSSLTVRDSGTFFVVNTGKIRFQVKKSGFNLIDQAWVDESGAAAYTDANKIVASHSRGIVYYQAGVEHLSSNDAATTVTIAKQGPGVVCIKATGVLKSTGGAAPLHFITRLYAFNNSSTVRIQNTVENWDATTTNYLAFKGWQAEIPLTLGTTRTALVSKPGGFETATLSGSQDLYCLAKRPDTSTTSMGQTIEGIVGGAVSATFNPKVPKATDLGWAALSDGNRGCMVSMKYFWQMAPTSVEALANGTLVAGMYTNRVVQPPVRFYAGAARTVETQWTFFNTQTGDALRSKAAGATNRLFALAPSYWYTRATLASVKMVEKNQSLYTTANWGYVSTWETKLNSIWIQVLGADGGLHGFDSYGFLEWGDNPHYNASTTSGGWIATFPWYILWNGNYYGLDFFAFEHFCHTGDIRFLEYGIAHARHVQDIQMVHMGPSGSATGGSRYCPPAYHFSVDDDPTTVAGTFTVDNPSHHKTEALWMDYYLTGNEYALQVALEGTDYMNRSGIGYAQPSEHTTTYIRRWSHQMYALVWGYEYNRDPRYLSTLAKNWDQFKKDIRDSITIGQAYMIGLAMEAVVKMHNVLSPTYQNGAGQTIPDSIPFYMKKWVDRVGLMSTGTSSTQVNANVTLGCAFLAPYYGTYYQKLAASKANSLPTSPGNLHKDFAQQARNLEMAMYYMAIPESASVTWTPIAVETAQKEALESVLSLTAGPTPLNPSTLIAIEGSSVKSGVPIVLKIYTADGRQVSDLSDKVSAQNRRVVWNADHLASGVYTLRCTVGNLSVKKKVVLAR